MNPGDWAWSTEHEAICRILDVQTVWDHTLYRMWLPIQDAVAHVRADRLKPLDATPPHGLLKGGRRISTTSCEASPRFG